ncbi:hypothetical protein AcV5_003443 [Taiwanofungus camphoratus]|nr:hypothetical protein AcV5_003443 [Antrodia cinnamomea]
MLDRQGRKIQCVEEPYSADFSISTSDQEKYCIKKGIFFQEDAPLQVLHACLQYRYLPCGFQADLPAVNKLYKDLKVFEPETSRRRCKPRGAPHHTARRGSALSP